MEWVERVWELNSKDNVKAADYNIIKEFECPIFYNLKINASMLSLEERKNLGEKINKYGTPFDFSGFDDLSHFYFPTCMFHRRNVC